MKTKQGTININGKAYPASKPLIEASKNAAYPKYRAGDTVYIIQSGVVLSMFVSKIEITKNGIEYFLCPNPIIPNGVVVPHDLIFDNEQKAYMALYEICY